MPRKPTTYQFDLFSNPQEGKTPRLPHWQALPEGTRLALPRLMVCLNRQSNRLSDQVVSFTVLPTASLARSASSCRPVTRTPDRSAALSSITMHRRKQAAKPLESMGSSRGSRARLSIGLRARTNANSASLPAMPQACAYGRACRKERWRVFRAPRSSLGTPPAGCASPSVSPSPPM